MRRSLRKPPDLKLGLLNGVCSLCSAEAVECVKPVTDRLLLSGELHCVLREQSGEREEEEGGR